MWIRMESCSTHRLELLWGESRQNHLLKDCANALDSDTLQHYKDIPITSMPYGQAMAIMALVEFLRVYI